MWTSDAAFPGWRKNIILIWLSQLLVMSGFDATIPFIALLLRDQYGIISEGERGIYMSMFYFFGMLGYVISCPVWGALGDRFGIKVMLLRGTFLTAFIFPLMGYASEVWILITLRFITAACAGTTSASQMLLAKTVPDHRQGFALGLLSTAIWSGSMLGNVIGGYTVHYFGYKVAFLLCGIMYFVAGLFVLFLQDAAKTNMVHVRTSAAKPEKVSLFKKLHLPSFTISVWLMLLIFLMMGFMRRFEVPYLAMRIEQITGPEDADKWTGLISAYVAAGAMISGAIIGYLADKWRPFTLIIPGFLASAVLLIVQAATNDIWIFGTARTLMYFFAGGLIPVSQKILSIATPLRKRGLVFGWSSTWHTGGIMLQTVAAGVVISVWGTIAVFYVTAQITVLFLPITLYVFHKTMQQRYYKTHDPRLCS